MATKSNFDFPLDIIEGEEYVEEQSQSQSQQPSTAPSPSAAEMEKRLAMQEKIIEEQNKQLKKMGTLLEAIAKENGIAVEEEPKTETGIGRKELAMIIRTELITMENRLKKSINDDLIRLLTGVYERTDGHTAAIRGDIKYLTSFSAELANSLGRQMKEAESSIHRAMPTIGRTSRR